MTTAAELVELLRDGKVTSRSLVEQSFARIEETEADIQAWAYLDKDAALARADEMDAIRYTGRPMGALHGIPSALKTLSIRATCQLNAARRVWRGASPMLTPQLSRDCLMPVPLSSARR